MRLDKEKMYNNWADIIVSRWLKVIICGTMLIHPVSGRIIMS